MHIVFDLGTSTFRAAVPGQGEWISEPSVVAFDEAGRCMVGAEAAEMIGRNPQVVRVVRPIQAGAVADFDAVVQLMQRQMARLSSAGWRRRCTVTLSIPAELTQVERKALAEAATAAGAKQVEFMEACVAAAIGTELPIGEPTGCFVVNLGAGITEAAILSMGGIVNYQFMQFGGAAIDAALMERLKKEYGFLIGQLSAERLKRACSTRDDGMAELVVKGRNLSTGLPDQRQVPVSLVHEQLDAYADMVVDLMVQTLTSCLPELVGDIMDRGIVLVGGGAECPRLVERLKHRTEVPMVVADNPLDCVIRGLQQHRPRRSIAGWKRALGWK
ncbi:rod shape-determining protein [Alicyclobacillus contaminans]|uniref:rod shape-determining protein n=1 Tax=Alicyclobacillus contaminans TaxID=392016 RepID=UPI0006844B94|nr:rod shape-determining protein [Alicyclobacillus contaminans]